LIAQPDMAMTTFTELLNQLDPDDNVRGKRFERICKWYLQHDPVYAGELRHVWLWKDWPDRWSDAEAGIDLVAEDRQGHLWAIQTKAYDPAYWVTKRDVDTFLSESNRRQFSFLATTMVNADTSSRAETKGRSHRQIDARDPGRGGRSYTADRYFVLPEGPPLPGEVPAAA
jgi:predicted helicase